MLLMPSKVYCLYTSKSEPVIRDGEKCVKRLTVIRIQLSTMG